MAKGKPITQLVPDVRKALEEALEVTAGEITEQLKIEGPYWTGFFESLWQVNAGKESVKPNIKDPSTKKTKQPTRDYTPVEVPYSPNLGGYTIGNRANYRLYAMDLLPSPTGRGAYPTANLTAQKNWFDLYVNAKMPTTIEKTFTSVFRRYTK